MEQFLRIDTTTRSSRYEPVAEKYRTYGGRGLLAKLLLDEVKPTCEPLGRNNKLILATGLLAGTAVSSSGRLSIGAKSPLTRGIKEANAGGITAARLARLGLKAVIVEGLPADDRWHLVVIDAQGCRFESADEFVGQGTYALCEALSQRYPKAAITCIGPAGEHGYSAAGIATIDKDGAPSRFSGRGGLGAVMGSKRIKAFVVDQAGKAPLADEEAFKQALREYTEIVRSADSSAAYRDYGTAAMVQYVNTLGGLPVNNFSSGEFDRVDRISGETLFETIRARGGKGRTSHACMPGCVIACSNVYADERGETLVSPLEYETIGMLGSNLGIGDLDAIARFNHLCNDIGLDTIETGAAVAVAMEAGVAEFGDVEAVLRLLEETRQATVLGRVLGHGAAVTGKVFGVLNVPVVKGQAMAAYDPRAIKGMGVTYATSAMGADHTAGPTARSKTAHSEAAGMAALSLKLQKLMPIFDCTGICLFAVGAIGTRLDLVVELINARFGWTLDEDWLHEMCLETLRDEYRFNEQAGFTKAHHRLNEAFTERQLPNLGTVFDVPDEELDDLMKYE